MDTSTHFPAALPDALLPVPRWAVFQAQGEDAASFLQGQLTQDVSTMAEGEARLAAYCSPKGRAYAVFLLVRQAPDLFFLVGPEGPLGAACKRLTMFVMRAQCRLGPALRVRLGAARLPHARAPEAPSPPDSRLSRFKAWALPQTRIGTRHWVALSSSPQGVLALCLAEDAADSPPGAPGPTEASTSAPAADRWNWPYELIQAGLPFFDEGGEGLWVPQMIQLESLGAVHFQKGCYPGQEVVARSQYRGVIKRRLSRFHLPQALPGLALPVAGQALMHSSDPVQPSGQVVLAAQGPQGCAILAEIRWEAQAIPGEWSLVGGAEATQGPCVDEGMPYPIDDTVP